MEKLLTRPDISSHFSHLLSVNLVPLIERNVKDAIQKSLIPLYSQQSSAMHQDLIRDLRSEMHAFKSELTGWQSESLRSQEVGNVFYCLAVSYTHLICHRTRSGIWNVPLGHFLTKSNS